MIFFSAGIEDNKSSQFPSPYILLFYLPPRTASLGYYLLCMCVCDDDDDDDTGAFRGNFKGL